MLSFRSPGPTNTIMFSKGKSRQLRSFQNAFKFPNDFESQHADLGVQIPTVHQHHQFLKSNIASIEAASERIPILE